jgi:hypothetical protein
MFLACDGCPFDKCLSSPPLSLAKLCHLWRPNDHVSLCRDSKRWCPINCRLERCLTAALKNDSCVYSATIVSRSFVRYTILRSILNWRLVRQCSGLFPFAF